MIKNFKESIWLCLVEVPRASLERFPSNMVSFVLGKGSNPLAFKCKLAIPIIGLFNGWFGLVAHIPTPKRLLSNSAKRIDGDGLHPHSIPSHTHGQLIKVSLSHMSSCTACVSS